MNADTRVGDYNPLGKVPVLNWMTARRCTTPRVIAEYLDNISPVSRILPQENRLLIATRRWEALADGIVDAAVAIVLEKRRPDDKQMPEVIARQRGKIDRGLAALAADLADRQWCNGVGLQPGRHRRRRLPGYLDFRFPEIDWRDSHPNLASLLERLMTRPSFADTLPPTV